MCATTVVATLVIVITVVGITVVGIMVVGIMVVATTIPVQRWPPGSRSASLGPRQGRRQRHTTTGRPATTRHMATMVSRLIRPTLILKATGGVDI